MTITKTRVRRTPEQRLADLEKKQAQILERQKVAIAKIAAAKARLMRQPDARKVRLEQERRFAQAVRAIAPDWDYRHVIAAVETVLAKGGNAEALAQRGEVLLQTHGQAKRGRRPSSA